MATQVQFRRGTAAQNNVFTGAAGELTINLSNTAIRVHNGTTLGGVEMARADLTNVTGSLPTQPAGSNTNVQFNDGGVMGGSNAFTFNNTTNTVSMTNLAITGNATVGNLIPSANATYSLGNTTNRWKDLYISGNTIYMDDARISSYQQIVLLRGLSITANGSVDVANAPSTGSMYVAANITAGNTTVNNTLTANVANIGNITGNAANFGNVVAQNITITGNVDIATLNNGNSNVKVAANSNVTVSVAGNANILTVTGTGANIAGGLSVTGNITGANLIATGAGSFGDNVNMNTNRINNLGYPSANTDAASKQYVDTLVSTGISYHQAVNVATTTTLAVATGGTTAYNSPNGAANGIGAYISTTGTFLNIDGANVQTVGTRILVKDEANAAWNGVYTYANTTAIVRSTDTDEFGIGSTTALSINDYFFTLSGVVNEGTSFIVSAPSGTITFGTSNITFTVFSTSQVYDAGSGITISGTTISANGSQITSANANYANFAGNVVNNSQPNITTVGTLTGLTSNGTVNFTGASNVSLGPVGNVKITGGSNAQVLITDGAGNLSWQTVSFANTGSNARYVAKNGDDTSGDGSMLKPYLTITAAMNSISDAAPTKRYAIYVNAGEYNEGATLSLKPNVFVVGCETFAVRIVATTFNMGAGDWSGTADNRSGFSNCLMIGACDWNWSTVTSGAGKLYFYNVQFSGPGTVNLYGYNNASAQAQFWSCVFFGAMTVSGINIGNHMNCRHFANITLNQHPGGGMATILNASGGDCGTVTLTTTVSDFNRRCALFAKSFYMSGLTVDGASSYADVTNDSLPSAGPTILNGGTVVYLNGQLNGFATTSLNNLAFPTAVNNPIMPATTQATNFGDWGKQWNWTFSYIYGSTGSDLYVISYGNSYAADTVGRNIGIYTDGAGLAANVNSGGIVLETSATTGNGNSGSINITTGTTVSGARGNVDITGNTVNITGNVTVSAQSNLGPVGNVTITGGSNGQILTTNGSGVLSWASPSSMSNIANGNSNVSIPSANGNVNTSVAGNANVFVVTGTGANVSGTLNVTGNISGGNLTTSGLANVGSLTATGVSNLGPVGNVTITGGSNGQVLSTNGSGVLTWTTPSTISSNIANGNSNVSIPSANGNVNTSVAGNANVFVVTGTGANVSGTMTATGNISGGNLTTAGLANVGSLTATGVSNLGPVGNVRITGGSNGQILTTDGSGVLSWAAPSSTSNIANGTSNVSIPVTNGNILFSSRGDANVVTINGVIPGPNTIPAGMVITGRLSVSSVTSLNILEVSNTANINVGNVTSNLRVGGNLTVIGNTTLNDTFVSGSSNLVVNGGNLTVGRDINVLGDIRSASGNISFTNGNISTANGNISSKNLTVANGIATLGPVGNVRITGGSNGQVLTTDGSGVLTWSTPSAGSTSNIANGNSNVSIPSANGNVNISSEGNANVAIITGTGANIAGTLTATGNVSGGNLTTAGAVVATGNVSGGNLTTAGAVVATGNVSGGNLTTSGLANVGSLTVTGVGDLGNVGNLRISGGNLGDVLISNGASGVSWAASASSGRIAVEEVIATAGQVNFTASNTPSGDAMLWINGVSISPTAVSVASTTISYDSSNNSNYVLVAGDQVVYSYIWNSSGQFITEEAIATAGQTVFTLTANPRGGLIMSLNGILVRPSAIVNIGSTVTYVPANNGGYVLLAGDNISFSYIET